MTQITLDLATLRSADNLLRAEPRVDGGRLVDLDITALGTLLEAICFSDEVIVPDLDHRLGRKITAAAGDAVRHVPLTRGHLDAIVADASAWLNEHCDTESLITLLGGRPTYGPVVMGTDEYLVLQAVGADGKYESAVVDAIRSTADDPISPWDASVPLKAVAHWIRPLHEPEMKWFATNIAWAGFRARCYLQWSQEHGIPYMPHPLRARMAGYAAATEGVEGASPPPSWVEGGGRCKPLVALYLDRLASVHRDGLEAVADVAGTTLLRFPFPSILPYAVERAGTRERILEVAYEVRDSRGARSLRSRVADFDAQLKAGDLQAAVRLREELEHVTAKLRSDLGLERNPPITTTLSIGLPGVSFGITGPKISAKSRGPSPAAADRIRRPWLVLLRDVFDALTSASSMGALYEVLYTTPPVKRRWKRRSPR